jgi:MYXO-CTERM domain-containing protein
VASTVNAPPFIPNDYTRLAASGGPGTILYETGDSSQSPFTIAVAEPTSAAIPEPSSLVIAMTLFGGLGLAGVWRRRKRQQLVTNPA